MSPPGRNPPLIIRHHPDVRESYRSLPPRARRAVKAALDGLAKGKPGLDVKALRGTFEKPLMRLRVGAYRIVFYRSGRFVNVIRVFPRRDGYDWLDTWEA